MIRLHFDTTDLRRITLAPAPNALWEAVLSVRGLRAPTAGRGRSHPAAGQWRRRLNGSLADRAGVLLDLVPRDGYLPDFLLQPAAGDLATAVDLAGRTPAERLAADLRVLPGPGGSGGGQEPPSRWMLELAAGSPAARRVLTADLSGYFASSIAPLWPRVRTDGAADRALRAEMLLRGGVDALLTTLAPTWRWDPPVLYLPSRYDYDVPLCGRGVLLMPSWFATGAMIRYQPDEPTVLAYPMHVPESAGTSAAPPGAVLGPLLGRTRAAVLQVLREPATTTALAERVQVSLATASQHAGVLRNAGLVRTTRIGTAVLHTLTPLGAALLSGEPSSA
ncbi:winged helix-turn-helix domain-containing protein [Actinacidiphila glaucinigra]|uniref:ArsR/SmtB family transcription factor n=1 Tax=Actinacidiphila glaucinigra TaxID=235986 RepID=UPI002DD9853B|nr:winged helix-turn-helix domain-containing protein [Actinacidiphila glaucinigra]WSD57889.1 winged helix-turn-helix domain-containing protein [Actinacidiphila glaucinigra]